MILSWLGIRTTIIWIHDLITLCSGYAAKPGQSRLNARYKRELSTFRALCAESSSDRSSGSSGCRA